MQNNYDSLFAEIARSIVANGQASTSYIQRTFDLGFNRASRILEQLEAAGIIGEQVGTKPREVKITEIASLDAKLQELGVGSVTVE